MDTLNIIKNTIKQHNLISHGDKIVVGVSGGADSCCLLHSLVKLSKEYELSIVASHINHNLRPDAINDQQFVERFCNELNIECYIKSADVKDYCSVHKISEEDAGRQIRYAFFNEIADKIGANKIATAHNKNDSAETVVMNFMRGSSLSGLCGIPYTREKRIIRPILDLSREQIEKYCADNNLRYVTDKTNFETIYTRNKIRLELIPYIEKKFNPAFVSRIIANADIISAENDFVQMQADVAYARLVTRNVFGYTVDISMLNAEHLAIRRRILVRLLQNITDNTNSFSGKYIDSILNLTSTLQTGKSIDLPDKITAKVSYGKLIISKKGSDRYSFDITPLTIGENKISNFTFSVSVCSCAEKANKNTLYIHRDCLDGLSVRTRKNGDYFYPVGMAGRKKLTDFFIDLKIPSQLRDNVPLVVTAQNDIVWIAGKRADRRFIADTGSECIKIIFTEDERIKSYEIG